MYKVARPSYTIPLPCDALAFGHNGKMCVRVIIKGETRMAEVCPNGERVRIYSKHWYIRYKDARGVWRRVKGYEDRDATEEKAKRISRGIEHACEGLLTDDAIAPSTGFVYFIEAVGSDCVRIGYSANPHQRLDHLKYEGVFNQLRLLHTVPGSLELEKGIQCRLAGSRKHGHWFFMTDEVRSFIEYAKTAIPSCNRREMVSV